MITENLADIFLVKKYNDDGGIERQKWVRVGVAFPHKNAPGYSLRFDIYPHKSDIDAGHNIVIKERDPDDERFQTSEYR
jgi:hypothetical protein